MCVCLCALGGVAHFAVLLLVPHRDPSGDKITDRQNGPTPSSKLHASPVKISSRHPAGLPSYLYKYLGNPGSSRAPSSNHFILLSFSPSLLVCSFRRLCATTEPCGSSGSSRRPSSSRSLSPRFRWLSMWAGRRAVWPFHFPWRRFTFFSPS